MTPYKDPEKQRAYQKESYRVGARQNWLKKQECCLCGSTTNLRVFKHVGAPPLSWSNSGPSHRRFRITCRRTPLCEARQRKGKPEKKKTEVEVIEPRKLTRLEKEILKPDKRPMCPVHGHRGTVTLRHIRRPRFVCCGREHVA